MKNIFIIGLLTLIVLIGGCAGPKSTVTPDITQTPANVMPAPTVTQSLKYQLSANDSYVAGTPITINFTLETFWMKTCGFLIGTRLLKVCEAKYSRSNVMEKKSIMKV